MPACGTALSPAAPSHAHPAVGSPSEAAGRHRRAESIGAQVARTLDLVARVGSAVALTALLVVAGAAAGLVNGASSDGIPTMTVTFDHQGH